MFLIGSGIGIIYVGVLCLMRAMVEFNDIVTNGAVLEDQVYRVAMELMLDFFLAGTGIVILGAVITILGFGYRVLAKKEAASS